MHVTLRSLLYKVMSPLADPTATSQRSLKCESTSTLCCNYVLVCYLAARAVKRSPLYTVDRSTSHVSTDQRHK